MQVESRVRSQSFTAIAYLAGVILSSWVLADVLGSSVGASTGWKIGGSVLAFGSGGLRMLVAIVKNGLAENPPWLWYSGKKRD